jgi:hypothetical protein
MTVEQTLADAKRRTEQDRRDHDSWNKIADMYSRL